MPTSKDSLPPKKARKNRAEKETVAKKNQAHRLFSNPTRNVARTIVFPELQRDFGIATGRQIGVTG
jgi:hypothetical protein